jgi:hypothetical protein
MPCQRRRTPAFSCCRKPERRRSGGWRQSAARRCSARDQPVGDRLHARPPTVLASVCPSWDCQGSPTLAYKRIINLCGLAPCPPAAPSLVMFRDLAVPLTPWPRTANTAHAVLRQEGDEGTAGQPRFTSSMPLALRQARTDGVGRPAPSAVTPRRSTAAARPRGGPRTAGTRRPLPERAP